MTEPETRPSREPSQQPMSTATREPLPKAQPSASRKPLSPEPPKTDHIRSSISLPFGPPRSPSLVPKRAKRKRSKRDRHKRISVSFFRYCYYEPAFKYFVEQVLDAEFLPLPEPTKHTVEVGAQNSSDYVCAPFKHILGDYVEALERGADVLVQFTGPCRLGYYGELQESILRGMGYDFEMLNFSEADGRHVREYVELCRKTINPDVSIPNGVKQMLACLDMITKLDDARDYYLANAGFEDERGSFRRVWNDYMDDLSAATSDRDINEAFRRVMGRMRDLPNHKPADPIRIGIVGEYFTAIDEASNLQLDQKLLDMGVELHRLMNMTNRLLRYNEQNLRLSAADYLTYDMGPTSTLTVAATLNYARDGFDGVIHAKSAGCTPEIDCVPVLQRISRDTSMPVLYLSYDAQTSDTGLNTRLEAFYDMLAIKKERSRL